jgi:transcriptional regulator with XRE-family HTH domain
MDMSGEVLRAARLKAGLNQVKAARRLGLSQSYLSMLEGGSRQVSRRVLSRLMRVYALPPTARPLSEQPLDLQELAVSLGSLGYRGYGYLSDKKRVLNPAVVLLEALKTDLEPRLAAALPWLVFHYADLPWEWLVERAKVLDLQNRLGFVVAVARELAQRRGDETRAATLMHWEQVLERARLVREDTFGRSTLTETERTWLRESRPDTARQWNLLTRLSVDDVEAAS